MNPISILVSEHRRMEKMLSALLEAEAAERSELWQEAADTLAAHVLVEEEHFYPAVRARRTEDILLESLEEHLSLKRLVADLLELDVHDIRWEAKLHVLKEQVEHHHMEEEKNLFPKVEKCFDADALSALGDQIARELDLLRARSPRIGFARGVAEAAPLDPPSAPSPLPSR